MKGKRLLAASLVICLCLCACSSRDVGISESSGSLVPSSSGVYRYYDIPGFPSPNTIPLKITYHKVMLGEKFEITDASQIEQIMELLDEVELDDSSSERDNDDELHQVIGFYQDAEDEEPLFSLCFLEYASAFSGGEARYEEMVAKDTQTGEFIRLGSLNNIGSMAVIGDGQFVVTYYERMEACDLSTGEWYFPLEQYSGGEDLRQKVIDIAYDAQNRLILLLTTLHVEYSGHIPDELKKPMLLEVYREDWTLVRTIDTGILPPHSQVFGVISPGIRLEQPGRLSLGENAAAVEYLE